MNYIIHYYNIMTQCWFNVNVVVELYCICRQLQVDASQKSCSPNTHDSNRWSAYLSLLFHRVPSTDPTIKRCGMMPAMIEPVMGRHDADGHLHMQNLCHTLHESFYLIMSCILIVRCILHVLFIYIYIYNFTKMHAC